MSDTPRETRSQQPDANQQAPEIPDEGLLGTETPNDQPEGRAPSSAGPMAPEGSSADPTVPEGSSASEPSAPESSVAEPSAAGSPSDEDPAVSGSGGGESGIAAAPPAAAGSRNDMQPSDAETTAVIDRPSTTDDATQVMPTVDDGDAESRRVTREELYARDDRRGEQERLAAVRAEHEAATTPAEPVPAAAPEADASTTAHQGRRKRMKYPRTTDRFFPSLGLLLLRLTMAVTFGVHGVQKLLSMEQTSQFFESLSLFGMALPYPSILALATGVAEVMIAVSLAFGFLVRFASVGILLISVGALLMVKMTTLPNPLEPGASGIDGELELVLAGGGVLLLCVGGGAWALDRLFRRGRYSKDPQDLMD